MAGISGLGLGLSLASALISRANAAEPVIIVDVSKSIAADAARPQGYKGGEDKVSIDASGKISTNAQIVGNDAGFYVGFKAIPTHGATKIQLTVKGDVFQKSQWDNYLSIQAVDSNGTRHILKVVCNQGLYGSECTGQTPVSYAALKNGQTFSLDLQGMTDIVRIDIVFPGDAQVAAGFSVSDIKLVK